MMVMMRVIVMIRLSDHDDYNDDDDDDGDDDEHDEDNDEKTNGDDDGDNDDDTNARNDDDIDGDDCAYFNRVREVQRQMPVTHLNRRRKVHMPTAEHRSYVITSCGQGRGRGQLIESRGRRLHGSRRPVGWPQPPPPPPLALSLIHI